MYICIHIYIYICIHIQQTSIKEEHHFPRHVLDSNSTASQARRACTGHFTNIQRSVEKGRMTVTLKSATIACGVWLASLAGAQLGLVVEPHPGPCDAKGGAVKGFLASFPTESDAIKVEPGIR